MRESSRKVAKAQRIQSCRDSLCVFAALRDFFSLVRKDRRMCFELGRDQPKDRDLWPAVEAHRKQMPEAAVDVELAAVVEVELTGSVAAIAHGQQRRPEKRWLALTAVSVAGEDPAAKPRPVIAID